MIKLSQGGTVGQGYTTTPLYISHRHIVAVKPGGSGLTKVVTTACKDYAAFIVNETIDEVCAAIQEATK